MFEKKNFSSEGARVRPRFNANQGGNGENRRPRQRFQRTSTDMDSAETARPARYERVEHNAHHTYAGNRPAQHASRSFNEERRSFSQRPAFNAQQQGRPAFNARPADRGFSAAQAQGDSQTRSFRTRPQRNEQVYSERKRQNYRERYEDPTKPIRLNKFLANAGICSRREADDFIQAGVITVNGEVVDSLGAKVLPTDRVMFHDQPVHREKKVYILLNKPKNTVTTNDDPEERRTVLDIVKNACAERIYPVGRLDRNTTGVLLLTNDGDLAAKLTHPKFGKKKIYAATIDRDLDEADEIILRAGVTLDGEKIIPDALEFPKGDRMHIGLEIHSGQNRVVRRMFEQVGYRVTALDRVSFAGLTKKNVPRGHYRFLTPKEVAMLQMGAFE